MGSSAGLILNIVAVGCGSFVGGVLRYLISLIYQSIGKGFPWGTLFVNVLGCFLLGYLSGLFSRTTQSQYINLFFTVGLCGGFTTFSTFSKECFTMLQSGDIFHLIIYSSISLLAGILCLFVGFKLSAASTL